jgi:hypothetical protein
MEIIQVEFNFHLEMFRVEKIPGRFCSNLRFSSLGCVFIPGGKLIPGGKKTSWILQLGGDTVPACGLGSPGVAPVNHSSLLSLDDTRDEPNIPTTRVPHD